MLCGNRKQTIVLTQDLNPILSHWLNKQRIRLSYSLSQAYYLSDSKKNTKLALPVDLMLVEFKSIYDKVAYFVLS